VLDAHQLNVFLTAAETLNFTEAARLLNMTQPSVSQHIQTLEQHFQTPLFVRAGRQLSLTDAGLALVPMARQMVRLSVRIDETMESLQGEVFGHLLVGCSTTSGKYVLPFLLAHFLREHPKVQATCQVAPRRQAVDDLCDGKVHIALASPQDFARRDVEYRLFFTDPILLIAPCNHPWADRDEVSIDELRDADLIMREEGSGTFDVVQQGIRELGFEVGDLNAILTLGNSEAIALAVQEGLGVGFVSRFVVQRLVQGGVHPLRVRGMSLHQEVYIAQSKRHQATKAQSAFWKFVTNPRNPVLRDLAENGLHEMSLAGVFS
jgi:DNA-binding transcriptional LysR family regulator